MKRISLVALLLAVTACGSITKVPAPKPIPNLSPTALGGSMPTKVVPLQYPSEAIVNGKAYEGWVVLSFMVDQNGKAAEIAVKDESPVSIFRQSAIDALKQYEFEVPSTEQQAKQERREILFNYELHM